MVIQSCKCTHKTNFKLCVSYRLVKRLPTSSLHCDKQGFNRQAMRVMKNTIETSRKCTCNCGKSTNGTSTQMSPCYFHTFDNLFSDTQFYTLFSPMVCTPCRKKSERYVRVSVFNIALIWQWQNHFRSGLLYAQKMRTRLSPTFKDRKIF